MEDNENRSLPQNDLDFNLMLTDSVWGRNEVSKDLKDKLAKFYLKTNAETGENSIEEKSLWGLLSFFTRDMRLGNLSEWNNELQTCRYMIELSNDLLVVDMKNSFGVALSRVATILETSQSKGGFLRKAMNTLRQEHYKQEIEAPKKSFFGGNKKDNLGGGY